MCSLFLLPRASLLIYLFCSITTTSTSAATVRYHQFYRLPTPPSYLSPSGNYQSRLNSWAEG